MTTRIDAVSLNATGSVQKADTTKEMSNVRDNTPVFETRQDTQQESGIDPKEAIELAKQNGYGKYYDTKVVTKNGKTYIQVTVKTEQSIGILAEDFLKRGTVNDGTLKENNPNYFVGIHCTDGEGRTASDLNYRMKPGDKLLIPADKVDIKRSTIGWFRRHVMNIVY